MLLNCGIYKIINKVNGKIYIGSSTNLKRRERQHFSALLNNKHENNYLQNSYLKYGKDNFKWEIIEFIIVEKELLIIEQIYLDLYKNEEGIIDKNKCYNLSPKAGNCLGIKRSEKTIKLLSEVHKNKKLSEEHKKNISRSMKGTLSNKGYKHTEEAKNKISISSKNNKNMLGKKHTEESKNKMSISKRGIGKKVINLTTNEIFNSLRDAANFYNLKSSVTICNACKGKLQTAGGYKWSYLSIPNKEACY